jgi:hypothetical protein
MNMINSVLFMSLSPLVGQLADSSSLSFALALMAVALVAASVVLAMRYRPGQPEQSAAWAGGTRS